MITKEELLKDAKHVLELYGEPTVASDFAKKVEEYLTNGWGIPKSSQHMGEYTHTLSLEEIPHISFPYGIEAVTGKKK